MDTKEWVEAILANGGHRRGEAGGQSGFVVEQRDDGGANVRWVPGPGQEHDPDLAGFSQRSLGEYASTLHQGGVDFTRDEDDGRPYLRCSEQPTHGG
jgi:hypothetical protein